MNKKLYSYIAIIGLLTVVFATGGAWAGLKNYSGSIQGANCVVHNTKCPLDSNDAHVALENEFVLLQSGGKYFFLQNLDRAVKIKHLGEEIRITGEAKGDRLLVSKIAVKKGGTYRTVWDWKEIARELESGNVGR